MKKTLAKILAIALCAVLLVSGTIYITLAYLQDQTNVVQNTFTVSDISLTLNETDVTELGKPIEDAPPVEANDYKLIPGTTYVKDPTVHVGEASEDCLIVIAIYDTFFSALGNMEEAYDTGEKDDEGNAIKRTVYQQIEANGWVELEGYTIADTSKEPMKNWFNADETPAYKLFYLNRVAKAKDDIKVFDGFKLSETIDNNELTALGNRVFQIVAFGMQATGYQGVADDAAVTDKIGVAFAATFGEKVTTNTQGGEPNINN